MKNALMYFCWLCLLFGVAGGSASGQESDRKEGHQFVVMPRDIGLPLVVV